MSSELALERDGVETRGMNQCGLSRHFLGPMAEHFVGSTQRAAPRESNCFNERWSDHDRRE